MKYLIFGESHGPAIGVTMEGVPPGIELDRTFIEREMARRAPGKNPLSTPRSEADAVKILSGVFNGKTTGAPLCAIIENTDTRSKDYEKTKDLARPGHADYTGNIRYQGLQDYRGGGHFSGRLTAPLVFAGAVAKLYLKSRGIQICAHVKAVAGIFDQGDAEDISAMLDTAEKSFPVLDNSAGNQMQQAIIEAKNQGDSVGGLIECVIFGMPAGYGEPGQNSAESVISRQVFAVPAVKGIEFGAGFRISEMTGSQANDAFYADASGVHTKTNHNGGVNGGITNGMPVVFTTGIKPTPSIAKKQETINMKTRENTTITIEGRHDPCIVQRAVPVMEAAAALAACEILGI